jgi:hypothetical protein
MLLHLKLLFLHLQYCCVCRKIRIKHFIYTTMPNYHLYRIRSFIGLCCLLFLFPFEGSAQGRQAVQGLVTEIVNGQVRPVRAASIVLQPYGFTTFSDTDGTFSFTAVPNGAVRMQISYVGKVTVDTLIQIPLRSRIDILLSDLSFRLREVDVLARSVDQTKGSTSYIGQNAIAHLQANSLADIMSLLPGGLTANPNLTGAKQFNIRSVADGATDANAFGTSIIINGSPLSNNANLQSLSPVMTGGATGLGGGGIPRGGIDTRNVPMYNVESVEVIRGIPGARYGDIVSGAVIVNQKAGRQPLLVEANTNPNVYSINASKGMLLGRDKGALNIGSTYAYNVSDPVQSYRYYQRASVDALYSNSYLSNRLSNTLGLTLHLGRDTRRLNPDDEITRIKSSAQENGFSIHTRGDYRTGKDWWRGLDYAARLSYTHKNGDYQEQYTAATSAYGMTYLDGAILTNRPGMRLYDVKGMEITRIPEGEESKYAVYLPSTYLGKHQVEGKELNLFLNVGAQFFNRLGNTAHRWSMGADYRSDANKGAGKSFADSLPPYRNLQYVNSAYRNRSYSDIPALHQLGLYVEDNIVARLMGRTVNVAAGLRYDYFGQGRSVWAPRLNANMEVFPGILVLRAGYGVLAKGPSLLYLYPENAYFDYVNVNEMATGRDDAVFMTTTRVFETQNPELKIETNVKSELGLDFKLGKSKLSLTGFKESRHNGYGIGNTIQSFRPVQFIQYERISSTGTAFKEISSDAVLAKFNRPHNNNRLDKTGIEFQLDLARINSIRTQFGVYGAYIRQKAYTADYFYYDGQSGAGANSRTHIGLYEPEMTQAYDRSLVSTLKMVHNIPKIGLAVTLTADIIWNESDWTVYGNDSIPVKYIDKNDGQVYNFDLEKRDNPAFKALLRPVARTTETVESYPPMVNFNINLTKEIKDFMRVSFFANNMFRYHQVVRSDRVRSDYYRRNIPFFFGFKMGLYL